MAEGDLTASTATECTGIAAVKTAIDALNLAAATDFIAVLPIGNSGNTWAVFKIEREAAA
tara:strand:+ start:558 stop:737 length:180 start_codon:yes stop_codon:yes gene_type:complete